jgi:hypothetical protein
MKRDQNVCYSEQISSKSAFKNHQSSISPTTDCLSLYADRGHHKLKNMNQEDINKAIKVVGSEEKLNKMVLQVAKMWKAIFLRGLISHLKAGKSLAEFFINDDPNIYLDDANPEHLRVERDGDGFRMDIGICCGGDCGESGKFMFDADGKLNDDSPPDFVMY